MCVYLLEVESLAEGQGSEDVRLVPISTPCHNFLVFECLRSFHDACAKECAILFV